jgi:hypothetical protein
VLGGVEAAVEVGAAAEVAVGVVGVGLAEAGKQGVAAAADFVDAEDGLVAVLADGVEGVGEGDAGDLVAAGLVGDLVPVDAAGVFAAGGAGVGVVGPGGVGGGVFVDEAGEQGRLALAGDGDLGVGVASFAVIGVADGVE